MEGSETLTCSLGATLSSSRNGYDRTLDNLKPSAFLVFRPDTLSPSATAEGAHWRRPFHICYVSPCSRFAICNQALCRYAFPRLYGNDSVLRTMLPAKLIASCHSVLR